MWTHCNFAAEANFVEKTLCKRVFGGTHESETVFFFKNFSSNLELDTRLVHSAFFVLKEDNRGYSTDYNF